MKRTIIFITTLTFITIITGISTIHSASAFKYIPPPPPVDAPDPEPDPPREEQPIETPSPPTPTPCIPNWCFVQQTSCCFDPICIFLGETTKGAKNRCDRSPGTLKYFSTSPRKSVSILSKISLFINSFFNRKAQQ